MAIVDINGKVLSSDEGGTSSGFSQTELQRKFGGKNIIWLGDSVHAYTSPDGATIPYYFQYHSGANCYNWCQGGTTMALMGVTNYDPYSGVGMVNALTSGNFTDQITHMEDRGFVTQVAQMQAFDMSKADYIIIEFGTNDCWKLVPVDNEDDEFDTTTTGGALRYMIKTLLTKYPALKLAVCNMQDMTGFADAEHQKPYDSAAQNGILESVCEQYHIPLVDIRTGMNDYTIGLLGSAHRTHEGKMRQVQAIENTLCRYY
jgi:lysophospholipase L1-like esterase